jgi:hypothetical protein
MHIHLDAHMHFHKHIKQASLDAPSHHPAHGNRRHDSS